jgi:xanthine dehydrogenase accessory factor
MKHFFEHLTELLAAGEPVVAVTVVDALGSVPQNQGAKMLVTAAGLHHGTVGGGKVEAKAIGEAQAMLRGEIADATRYVEWNLKRDVGMTCGGSFRLFFELFNRSEWQIVIFGAGHVSQALNRLLVELDCRITCFDTRQEWLDRLPDSPRLRHVLSDDLPGEVAGLPEGAFVLLMTMGHTTDKPILIEILRQQRDFPYLGVIGSRAKAMRLKKDITEAGLPDEARDAFYCPIGLPLGSHHPMEIAVSVAAQLLQERDRLWQRSRSSAVGR